jgi:transketolase
MNKGGYLLSGSEDAEISLIASGSEVSLAAETAKILKQQGIDTKVVSVLNREKFMAQTDNYIEELVGGDNQLNVLLEAGVSSGWYQLLGKNSLVFGVEDFGISGPGEEVAAELNLNAEHIAEKIIAEL